MQIDAEQVLSGGNVAASVVRVGETVRKPATDATPHVAAFLRFLCQSGSRFSPRPLGIDEQGRQMLEFVPGVVAASGGAFSLVDLRRVGAMIRELHDRSARYVAPAEARWDVAMPPDAKELVCHNDLAPWNLVCGEGRWAFIDWDGAGPGSCMWDLAYAAITFSPVERTNDPDLVRTRIEAINEGYKLDPEKVRALPELMLRRALAMRDLLVEGDRTGRQPWARLFAEDHAVYWNDAAAFVREHLG